MCEPCGEAANNSAPFILALTVMVVVALALVLLLNPALLRRLLPPRSVTFINNYVNWFGQLFSDNLVAQGKIAWTGKVQMHCHDLHLVTRNCNK